MTMRQATPSPVMAQVAKVRQGVAKAHGEGESAIDGGWDCPWLRAFSGIYPNVYVRVKNARETKAKVWLMTVVASTQPCD